MEKHEFFMRRSLQLAEKGLGSTAPNPMVGAVIVVNGKIIGEGYTSPYGGPHAEVNAIASVKDKELLKTATLYVTLEPCSHFGKTPPCSNLIISSKIPKVVIGTSDTFSKVNGRGIKQLLDAGVKITTPILEKECREINKRFFTFHEKKRPYIILKWAQTLDGFIDKDRSADAHGVNWITQPETKSLVHLWRSQESGILVGKNTILNDDPKLDVRLTTGKSPIRIVLDPNHKINASNWSHLPFEKTIIFTKNYADKINKVQYFAHPEFQLHDILETCYEQEIQSIFVEGGAKTLQEFINQNLWDEARVLTGNTQFKTGLKAPEIKGNQLKEIKISKDILHIFKNY